jgi:SAM-dependent methyltransferase
MVHALRHAAQPVPTPDEAARQRFVLAFKKHLSFRIRPGNEAIYRREIEPSKPADLRDLLGALYDNPKFALWAALQRCSQEMMWQAVGETVFREEARITAAATSLRAAARAGGTVTIGQVAPQAVQDYERFRIHLQPRGYLRDAGDDDVTAGALYEAGGNLYSMGRGMGKKDSKAEALIRYLRQQGLAGSPRRILDIGCSAGASTVPYAQAFPDAEVHGVDLGAGMVRFANARAEALGARVHFHQMDAADLRFADGRFDLIVSHNLMHEISAVTRRRMFAECRRLLAPAGLCVHQDVAIQTRGQPLFVCAERAYDVEFNDEPFWMEYARGDLASELAAAGFGRDGIVEIPLSKIEGPGHWYAIRASQAAVQSQVA